jgi:hypothetical protein
LLVVISSSHNITTSLCCHVDCYWKQLENKQEMKGSRFMKWNNCIN